jgi:hypothetical protein
VIDLQPYDPTDPAHREAMMGSVSSWAGRWPYRSYGAADLKARLRAEIGAADTKAFVIGKSTPLGLVVVRCAPEDALVTVVHCYVEFNCRRHGLATKVLAQLGVNTRQPTPVLFWTPSASRIAARQWSTGGPYRIYPQPFDDE